MARKADRKRLREIERFIEENPGSKPIAVAKGLALSPSSVTRSLPALEDNGTLLFEDKKGGLWPFGKRR